MASLYPSISNLRYMVSSSSARAATTSGLAAVTKRSATRRRKASFSLLGGQAYSTPLSCLFLEIVVLLAAEVAFLMVLVVRAAFVFVLALSVAGAGFFLPFFTCASFPDYFTPLA